MALRYGENASNIHLDPINKLQKRCVRIITFSHYLDSTSPVFRKLEIPNLKKNCYTSNIPNDVKNIR